MANDKSVKEILQIIRERQSESAKPKAEALVKKLKGDWVPCITFDPPNAKTKNTWQIGNSTSMISAMLDKEKEDGGIK